MKRIMQVNKFYAPHIGGIERFVTQVAEGLAEQVEMTVLVCSEDNHYHEEKKKGVYIIRVPSLFKMGNLPIPFGLIHTFKKLSKDQDVVHLHMPFPFGDLACLLSGYRGKIIVWWHSDVVRQKKLMYLYKPIMLKMLKRADKIVVATEGHIKGSAYLKPFSEKCEIIPFGVELKMEKRADAYIARKKLIYNDMKNGVNKNLREGQPRRTRFLFVGRLVYYKGCDILIRAFSRLSQSELIMAGDGDMVGECKLLAKKLGVEKRVSFLGKISEERLCQEYEECDVFVLPSVAKSEAFGLVQIEAMAFGKPVINTKLSSGVPYVSVNNVTGLTVKPGDEMALAEAMLWMEKHEEEREKMGVEARRRMKEEYTMDTMLQRLKKLYGCESIE